MGSRVLDVGIESDTTDIQRVTSTITTHPLTSSSTDPILQGMRMGDVTNNNMNTQSIADYLAQLLKDKKQLAAFPNVFLHLERLLDDEIGKVRGNLFQINGKKADPLVLPDGSGPPVTLSEKVYVPIKDYPEVITVFENSE